MTPPLFPNSNTLALKRKVSRGREEERRGEEDGREREEKEEERERGGEGEY